MFVYRWTSKQSKRKKEGKREPVIYYISNIKGMKPSATLSGGSSNINTSAHSFHSQSAITTMAAEPLQLASASFTVSKSNNRLRLAYGSGDDDEDFSQEDQPTSTSGSSPPNKSSLALQTYQTALAATHNDEDALHHYTRALELFQTRADATAENALYRALCLRAMARILSGTNNIVAALALWDQALETLEPIISDCNRYSQRTMTPFHSAANNINSSNNSPYNIPSLDACLVETLHEKAATLTRATPLDKEDDELALDCLVQALRFLLNVRHFEQTRRYDGLVYPCLTLTQHSQLLLLSVQQILRSEPANSNNNNNKNKGAVLLNSRDKSSGAENKSSETLEPEWMPRVEQAIHVLQTRHFELLPLQRLAVSSIQQRLAHIYVQFGDVEKSSQALLEACDLLLQEQVEPCAELLDSMDILAHLLEEMQMYDMAMQCYEKSLLLRNQAMGPDHIQVANALVNVARMMRLEENYEGSMDLIKAAKDIYSKHKDYQTLKTVGKAVLLKKQYEQAVAIWLQCVNMAEQDESLDKTEIYYSLALAYMGLPDKDCVSATMCLMEAIQHEGQVSEQEMYALLQQVEFLRREVQYRSDTEDDDDETSYSRVKRQKSYSSHPTDEDNGTYSRVEGEVSYMSQPTEEVETSGADSDGVDDEGTAFYDSESVSAFQPALRADIVQTISDDRHTFGTNSIIDFDVVPPSDEDVESDRQRTLEERDNKGDDVMADQESTDDAPPPAPVISPNSSLAEGRQRPPTSPLSPTRLREIATPTSPNGSLSVISSPLLNLKQRSASNEQASVSSSSQRSSLVKALANTFRRSSGDRSKSPGFNDTVKSVDREEGDKGAVRLPSEEEFHLAIDETNFVGPLKYIDLPLTKSWDSDISSITVRMDGANRLKNDGQELWWAVSTERFGNWFPTVVSHAVEAAEGFLSAKSIHSQKQQTALFDYATSEDSDDESSADVFDLPSSGGVADSKTQRQQSIARHGSSNEKYCSGALDLYSGHKRKLEGVEAEIQHFVQLIPEQKQQYGKSHLTVARSLFTLAVLYSRLGVSSSAPAIDCATEALRIQRECSATNDACRSLHFLAEVYILQKQYIAALSLYAEVLRMERAHFGHLSDETVNTLNCIGHVHALQNEFLSAMDSHQEALRILQESHRDNVKYPLVTETLCQIGSVYYRERNSFKKSKPSGDNYKTFIEAGMLETIARAHEERGSYKVAISFFEEKLAFLLNQAFESDPEDLDEVAETFSSLGMLNSKAGLLFEALDYFEKAEVEMKRLKCDEVHLATIGVLMGTVRNQLGDWQIALTLLQDSLHVLVREVGHEHETVAATWFQIGVVQAGLCKFENAMKCFTDAVDVLKRILGPNHPATLRARREIGNLYCINISECDTALELFDEILTAQRSLHGDRHPNIGETLHSIGRAYARRGDYASALQILEQTYYMRTEFLGHDVPCQADTLYEISLIHLKRKHYKRALQISDIVLAIREESLRDKHIDIALAFTVKGSCYVAQNKLEDADALLSKALNMAIEAVGDSHPSVAEIHVAMSSLHLKRCQFTLASRSIASALDIFEGASLKNDEYPPYKEAKLQLARIEHDEALFV